MPPVVRSRSRPNEESPPRVLRQKLAAHESCRLVRSCPYPSLPPIGGDQIEPPPDGLDVHAEMLRQRVLAQPFRFGESRRLAHLRVDAGALGARGRLVRRAIGLDEQTEAAPSFAQGAYGDGQRATRIEHGAVRHLRRVQKIYAEACAMPTRERVDDD